MAWLTAWQSGGNATGMSALAPDLGGKRLELLKEAVPRVSRVAFLWSPPNPGANVTLKETQAAAQALGLQLQSLEVREVKDLERAFEAAMRDHAQALTTAPDPVVNNARVQIVGFATKNRLPAMYAAPEFAEGDGLMSYAPSYSDLSGVARRPTSTKFSKAPNPPISRWSSRRSSNSSSI